MRGRLISLEGGEGAGKSTLLASLRAELTRYCGATLQVVREPGGTPLGEALRELLLEHKTLAPVPAAELMMMFASRAQLCQTVIAPALARGDWVLSDRYTDASYAYQGGGRGIDIATIADCERVTTALLQPDLTFLLDLPPALGKARIAGRTQDRIESESDDFFGRVRAAYLARAAADPQRFVILDARQSMEHVQQAASAALQAHLSRWQAI